MIKYVDKIVEDKTKDVELKKLRLENKQLNDELTNITETLEKMNKAKYLKNTDLSDLYDE